MVGCGDRSVMEDEWVGAEEITGDGLELAAVERWR